jgi:hypothetical protein
VILNNNRELCRSAYDEHIFHESKIRAREYNKEMLLQCGGGNGATVEHPLGSAQLKQAGSIRPNEQ